MASSAPRFAMPFAQWMLPTGAPAIGATLGFFVSGTNNAAATYADAGLAVANPNPVVAGSGGAPAGTWPSIFLNPAIAYKVVLKDSGGNQIWTADPVAGSPGLTPPLTPISASGALAAGLVYGVRTSLGAFNLALPALAGVGNYQGLEIMDIENSAAANNITLTGNGADKIDYQAGQAGNLVLDTNGARVVLYAVNGVWRALSYA